MALEGKEKPERAEIREKRNAAFVDRRNSRQMEKATYETIMNVLPAVGAQEQNGNIEGFSRSSQFRVSLVE